MAMSFDINGIEPMNQRERAIIYPMTGKESGYNMIFALGATTKYVRSDGVHPHDESIKINMPGYYFVPGEGQQMSLDDLTAPIDPGVLSNMVHKGLIKFVTQPGAGHEGTDLGKLVAFEYVRAFSPPRQEPKIPEETVKHVWKSTKGFVLEPSPGTNPTLTPEQLEALAVHLRWVDSTGIGAQYRSLELEWDGEIKTLMPYNTDQPGEKK